MSEQFYVVFEDLPANTQITTLQGYAVIEAVGIFDAAESADRLYGQDYTAIFSGPAFHAIQHKYAAGELSRVTTGHAHLETLHPATPTPTEKVSPLTISQETGYVQETPATPAAKPATGASPDNLSNRDYRSLGSQIADAVRRQAGKIISWTGRLAVAADGGPDWMEFSVLGNPKETMILRLDGQGLTLLPQPAPAANSRMANP